MKWGAALTCLVAVCGCQKAPAQVGSAAATIEQPASVAPQPSAVADMPADAEPPDSWPQWRGPRRNGRAHGPVIPGSWFQAPKKPLWQTPIGSGYSSPVVADGRVYLMARQEPNEMVLCFDAADGKEIWRHAYPAPFEPHPVGRAHGRGPKSTPVISDGRVYCMGISGKFHCLDAARGAVLWKFEMEQDFGGPQLLFGMTSSPLLDGGHVLTQVGGSRGGTVMAFDPETGEVVWRSLQDTCSYSSFLAADLAGTHQIVGMTGQRVVGLDAQTGELLWQYPFQIQYDESIPTPVVWNDRIVFTSVDQPIRALEITRQADKFLARVAWQNRSLRSYITSPTAYGDTLFGLDDSGRLIAIDLASGRTAWESGNFGQTASILVVQGRLLVLDGDGELVMVAASPDAYRELGRVQITNAPPSWAYPALVGGRLYVRDRSHLACFELGEGGVPSAR